MFAQDLYQLYLVNDILRENGIIDSSLLDREDPVHLAWSRDEVISLHEYLNHCIASNWIALALMILSNRIPAICCSRIL